MMRFNSKVLFVSAVLALTVLLSWASFFLMKKLLSYSNYRYTNFYSTHHKPFPQVLVIGNSRAGSNFSDAAFLPGDLLNLGGGGTSFEMLSLQALDMIELNPRLKFVVIEPYFLQNDYAVARQGHIQSLFSDRVKKLIFTSFSDFEKLIVEIFPVYLLNTNNLFGALYSVISDEPILPRSTNKQLDLREMGIAEAQKIKDQTYGRIGLNTVRQISDLHQACEKAGVTLLIFATPIHRFRSESSGWKAHILEVEQIASDLNIRFFDFSGFFIGERMFVDTVHLNSLGADSMSEILFSLTLGREN